MGRNLVDDFGWRRVRVITGHNAYFKPRWGSMTTGDLEILKRNYWGWYRRWRRTCVG